MLVRMMCSAIKRGIDVRFTHRLISAEQHQEGSVIEVMYDDRAPQEGTDLLALMTLIAKLYYAPRDGEGAIVEMSDHEFYELMMLKFSELSEKTRYDVNVKGRQL